VWSLGTSGGASLALVPRLVPTRELPVPLFIYCSLVASQVQGKVCLRLLVPIITFDAMTTSEVLVFPQWDIPWTVNDGEL
jgi:hypothetical protein